MLVYKFGGTSVGSVEQFHAVKKIIADGNKKIIVLSAMSGTTNSLEEISACFKKGKTKEAIQIISELEKKYNAVVSDLFTTHKIKQLAQGYVEERFLHIKSFANIAYTDAVNKEILAQGELLSTNLFYHFLVEQGLSSCLLPATEFMKIDEHDNPNKKALAKDIKPFISKHKDATYFITQGFICRNHLGEIDNLKRGGSDYTASLIGGAINSKEVQIWTDIDGFHNNDPRFVDKTTKIDTLSFNEAAELAYFGAKILHPAMIAPCREKNIPVFVKNTMEPSATGTKIADEAVESGIIKAVSAKDGITAIKIRSGRMLMSYGFLSSIFGVFEKYKTPIDVITTSEIAVSMTIDNDKNLQPIVDELSEFGELFVHQDQTIVCVVGEGMGFESGVAHQVSAVLADVNIRMMSIGGSNNNISIVIDSAEKQKALEHLNRILN